MEQSKKKELITILAVLLVIVLIVGGVIFAKQKSSNEEVTATTAPTTCKVDESVNETPVTQSADASDVENSTYKDGEYTATGSYSTPEGSETITVNLEIDNDVVTATSADASMKSNDSKFYACEFVKNYKTLVVGKSIEEIKLSRVSGSSLTSQGFNSAIEKIKAQAKS